MHPDASVQSPSNAGQFWANYSREICSPGPCVLAPGRNPFTRELLNEGGGDGGFPRALCHTWVIGHPENILAREICPARRRPVVSRVAATLVAASTEFLCGEERARSCSVRRIQTRTLEGEGSIESGRCTERERRRTPREREDKARGKTRGGASFLRDFRHCWERQVARNFPSRVNIACFLAAWRDLISRQFAADASYNKAG